MGFYLSQLKSRENHSFWYGNSHQSTHSVILSLWGLSEMDSITLVFYFSDRERLFIVDRHSYIEMHLGFDDFVEFSEEISEYSRCWLANFNFGLGQRLLTCARAHLAAILMCYNAISFRFYVIHRGTTSSENRRSLWERHLEWAPDRRHHPRQVKNKINAYLRKSIEDPAVCFVVHGVAIRWIFHSP